MSRTVTMLSGISIIGTGPAEERSIKGASFRAFDASLGTEREPIFHSATLADVDATARLAQQAFRETKNLSGGRKAQFLRAIAAGLEAAKTDLVEWAHRETALPIARLEDEVGRTASQLRLFAGLVEDGSWVQARLDTGDPKRLPLPKPDLRSMLRPIGPIAFSVAGGDTAAAFAAGCPVIVKAHPAHPATSEIVGHIIVKAAQDCEMPSGIFSLLSMVRTVLYENEAFHG